MAAAWLERPVEELRGADPGTELQGPPGRSARFIGTHPSRVLADASPSDWWAVDFQPPAEPDPQAGRPQVVRRVPLPKLEPKPTPAPEHLVEPPPPPEPTPAPGPEPPALELPPTPEPSPMPMEAPPAAAPPTEPQPSASADAAALIHQAVAGVVEQLQARGLLGSADGLATLPTEQVLIAPRRFQFRAVSHHGDLRGVARWNPDLAGVLSVWRDPADGRVFVVDGHHRAGLARRLGVFTLAVRFLEASTDREARITGALINVGHGNASPIDAAKLLRDGGLTPEQVAACGLPPGGRVIRDGIALAQLAPELFERVAIGTIAHDMGLALAAAGPNHTLQRDLARIARRNSWAAASVAEAAEMASLARVRTTEAEGLLPGLGLEESNLPALLEVRAAIRSRLRAELRVLGAASRSRGARALEAAGNVIDREASAAARSQTQVVADVFAQLINAAGPLADLVRMLADEVRPDRPAGAVVDQYMELLRSAIKSEMGGLAL